MMAKSLADPVSAPAGALFQQQSPGRGCAPCPTRGGLRHTATERLPVCDRRVSQLDGKVSLDEDGCEPVRGRGRHEVGD